MPLSAFLPLLLAPAWEFPKEPIATEIRMGIEVYRAGKGLDRVFREDRKVLGTWFDGRLERDVEYALWLSPRLLSRWLGYLEAKEKWPPGEMTRRWESLRSQLDGSLAFVIRLAAYPKVDPLEQAPCAPPGLRDLEEVRWLVTFGGAHLPRRPVEGAWLGWGAARFESGRTRSGAPEVLYVEPQAFPLARLQGRDRNDLDAFPWYDRLPFGDVLTPEFSRPREDPMPLGDYHAGWTMLWVRKPVEIGLYADLQVRVFSPSKERIASFRLVR